jgi:hypothetical protein
MLDINYFGAVVASLLAFGLGGLWYSPLMFSNLWLRESKVNPQEMKSGHGKKVYLLSFICTLISALAFSACLGSSPGLAYALRAGLIVGVFFIGMNFWINYLFSGRSHTLFFIDAGYHVVQFLAYGLIFGLWS